MNLNEGLFADIKVNWNGYHFIFSSVKSTISLEVISMGRSQIFENGLIIAEDVILKNKNFLYRGNFRFFFEEGLKKYREFEIKESIRINDQ